MKIRGNVGFYLTQYFGEVLAGVILMSALTLITLPTLDRLIADARRSDAMDVLSQVMLSQEQYFSDHLRYSTDLADLESVVAASLETETPFYKVKASTCGDGSTITDCVLLTALAINEQTNDIDLSLSSVGVKFPQGYW
ncbi:hypothetical protein A9Q99_14580 [Gammaproteobacteria bacterium 45_16_T64]|nr:hypothetical protein A9Q99_14580 [Gammaproteobacteria bacterium 45_16_T64]